MKFYICGKIGEDRPSPETLAKFKRAEDALKTMGHEVFNPTTSGLGNVAEIMRGIRVRKMCQCGGVSLIAEYQSKKESWYSRILMEDLDELSWCDAVLVLSDWHNSSGGKTELMLAMALGLPVYELAPNGHLNEVKFDVRKVVDYHDQSKGMTAGEMVRKLLDFPPDVPVRMSADFILGTPFEQGFDRQIHGPVYEVKDAGDMKSPHGMVAVLESYVSCSLNFD